MNKKYHYEIAFSLLAQDAGIALEINGLLSNRYSTFLYSERQKEIAGTDGELKFKSVFAEESRFVVVLYRDGWGKTPWTRMEEDAIRGRAYHEGYDFVKFIPLDEKQVVPQYLPRTQLWISALRNGIKGAASAIEARLEDIGGEITLENTTQRAARLSKELEFDKRKLEFIGSSEGVRAATESFKLLGDYLQEKIEEIHKQENSIKFSIKRLQGIIVIMGLEHCLKLSWKTNYSNSLTDSYLNLELWDRHPPFPGITLLDNPKSLGSKRFNFELLNLGEGGWVSDSIDKLELNAEKMSEFSFMHYMNWTKKIIQTRRVNIIGM